jgi:hypothetical protein
LSPAAQFPLGRRTNDAAIESTVGEVREKKTVMMEPRMPNSKKQKRPVRHSIERLRLAMSSRVNRQAC